jgi:hypothetical protein
MNESLIRKFCESRHRKLIVIIATSLFGLLVLIPLVDDYFTKKESHSALTDELDRARQTAEGLPLIEQQVAEIASKLAAMESRAISKASISRYRNKVVELVRDTGCQVRRFDVSTPTLRAWMQNDNPLETTKSTDAKIKKTPFSLEKRSVVLLVDGSMENLRKFLGQLNEEDSLAYLNRLQLQSNARGNEQVTLEIEMWLFALGRQKV